MASLSGKVAKQKADAVELLNHAMPATSIVFLSDGQASVGGTDSEDIKLHVAKWNKILKVPIFSVAFGRGADFDLLKGISESNNGFVKRVYEDGDASLQLEDFYSLISSPTGWWLLLGSLQGPELEVSFISLQKHAWR